MADLKVNSQLITDYGKSVTALGTDYISEINAIYKTIDELNNSWHGGSAESFNTAAKGYEADLKRLGTKIEELGSSLVSIAMAYDDYEQGVLNDINGL